MKKVLVTGADGFIGSHLTESLLEKGYDVKAFTYYNSFNTWGWLDTLPKEKLSRHTTRTAISITISSSGINADIKPRSKAFLKNSIPSIGIMPN